MLWPVTPVRNQDTPMLRPELRRAGTASHMGNYRVTIVNEHFSQSGEQDAPDMNEVWKRAISSAIEIGGEQVSHGNPFFGAEVLIEEDGKSVGRYLVSVGATPLKD
jgi:hypothetical protein